MTPIRSNLSRAAEVLSCTSTSRSSASSRAWAIAPELLQEEQRDPDRHAYGRGNEPKPFQSSCCPLPGRLTTQQLAPDVENLGIVSCQRCAEHQVKDPTNHEDPSQSRSKHSTASTDARTNGPSRVIDAAVLGH